MTTTTQDLILMTKADREEVLRAIWILEINPAFITYRHEINEIKTQWENMEKIEGYPFIDWPLLLPRWFPIVALRHHWRKDDRLEDIMVGDGIMHPPPTLEEFESESRAADDEHDEH